MFQYKVIFSKAPYYIVERSRSGGFCRSVGKYCLYTTNPSASLINTSCPSKGRCSADTQHFGCVDFVNLPEIESARRRFLLLMNRLSRAFRLHLGVIK